MRPYQILTTEEILDYITLVTDNYHLVETFTIAPPSVRFDYYDVYFTFQVGTKQETGDEYIFNEGDEFDFTVSESQFGFFEDIGFHFTFFYYELDKADIDDSKNYDNLKTLTFTTLNSREFSKTFDKPTYLMKEFQVEVMKLE